MRNLLMFPALLVLAALMLIPAIVAYNSHSELVELNEYIIELETRHTELKENYRELKELNHDILTQNEKLLDRLQELTELWTVTDMEVTGYAPMDPNAIPGWDYSGDPTVTASGHPVVVGETIAAGPSIPFGTRIYVEGFGWRIVHDRGGLIDDGSIDVAMRSKNQTSRLGRQTRKVLIPTEALP